MANKKKERPVSGTVNKLMGIVGGVILLTFIVVMVLLNFDPNQVPKVKLPGDFKNAKKVLVELDVKNRGKVQLELRNDLMPQTVKNFVQNILNKSYDKNDFYRVDTRIVQTGFSMASMKMELNNQLKPDQYALCMATDPEKNKASQNIFFIMKAREDSFFGKYPIFGRVANVESENVVDSIKQDDILVSAKVVSIDGVPYVSPAP